MPPGYQMGYAETLMITARAFDRDSNYRDPAFRASPERIYAAIQASAPYEGVSGPVRLDPSADRLGSFKVLNFQLTTDSEGGAGRRLSIPLSSASAQFEAVGSWTSNSGVSLSESIIFPGQVTTVPLDTASAQSTTNESVNVAGILIPLFTSFAALLALVVGAFVVIHHRRARALRREIEALSNQMSGVRVVTVDYDPRTDISFVVAQHAQQQAAQQQAADEAKNRWQRAEKYAAQQTTSTRGDKKKAVAPTAAAAATKAAAVDAAAATTRPSSGTDSSASSSTEEQDWLSAIVALVSPAASPKSTERHEEEEADLERGLEANAMVGCPEEAPVAAAGTQRDLQQYAPRGIGVDVCEHPPDLDLTARWYWQEQPQHMDKHHRRDIWQPGNFVAYAGSVCRELDVHWRAFLTGSGPSEVYVDLTDRISSTGVEAKVYNTQTGNAFKVDFAEMVQVNVETGFARKMARRELKGARAAAKKREKATSKVGARPEDLDGNSLIVYRGQMVQTSNTREDGWAYGTIMYDPEPGRAQSEGDGASTASGWFPTGLTAPPTREEMTTLATQLGGASGAADVIRAPEEWTEMDGSGTTKRVVVSGSEKQRVVEAITRTLGLDEIKVVAVERIQNASLWQTYAVKKQTIVQREANAGAEAHTLEKKWLFHGTDEATVPKILNMGYNRAFAGKNAHKFGKGVYFAKDAAYSNNYAQPNAQGRCYLFLNRVAVGEYAQGEEHMLAPPPRPGTDHLLCDSTVNNMRKPTIFVTYHDAQAYPEYLVTYVHTRR